MGDIKRLSCSCGYEKDLFTGAGLGGINFRLVEQSFPKEAKIIKKRLDAGEEVHYLLDNAISLCPKCRMIKTISRLSYTIDKDEERQAYNGKCDKCGGDIIIIPPEEVFCPICGQKPDLNTVGHWD